MADEVVEAQHIEVEPYAESKREDPPDWYDDTINVGDETNMDLSS